MKISTFFLSLAFVTLPLFSLAQDWETTFPNDSIFGSPGFSSGMDVTATQDGNYLILGETDLPTGAPRHYIKLAKTDAFGNQIWSHTYNAGEISQEEVIFISETPDGNIMVGGRQNNQPYLFKTNSLGEKIWESAFENITPHYAYGGVTSPNGHFLFVGKKASSESIFLLNMNAEGEVVWIKYFEIPGTSVASVAPTNDGGYIISGAKDLNAALIKLDSLGDLEWSKSYPFTNTSEGNVVKQTFDNGFVVGGSTLGISNFLPLIFKTDSLGNGEWTKILDGGLVSSIADLKIAPDSSILVTGTINVFWQTNNNGFLAKLSKDGETDWQQDFTSVGKNFAAVNFTPDDGIILAGRTTTGNMLLKKVGGTLTTQNNISTYNSINVYPNPFQYQTIFKIKNQDFKTIQLQIFDSMGKLVREQIHYESEFIFYSKNLSNGIYFYKIKHDSVLIGNGKLIISN